MLTSAFWAILVAVLGVAVWEVVVRKSVLIDNFSAEEEQVVIQHTTLPASAPRSKLASANHTSFPLRSDGVLFISHASSGPAREAALLLPRFGFHVLIGVKDKTERRSFLYSMRKGVELIDFDMADPSTYPNLIYRLRHIRRDLDRPVAGLVLNLAGQRFYSWPPFEYIGFTQAMHRFSASECDACEGRCGCRFFGRATQSFGQIPFPNRAGTMVLIWLQNCVDLSLRLFRLCQAFLELNMYQVFEDKKQQNAKLAQLTEFAANDTKPINPSGSQKSYPWNAQGLRLVTLTHEFDGGEASETMYDVPLSLKEFELLF